MVEILDKIVPVVYMITIGNHYYIGSTKRSINERYKEHICRLKANKHHNEKMQATYNRYRCFKVTVLEYVTSNTAIEREQYYIDVYKPDLNIIKKVANY